ncbi:MAG: hypothetical protein ACU841_09570 [Gammaproteobacteria bacterium]
MVFARFRDYWIAQPGAKGRKLDWQATWRNWVRSETWKPNNGPPGRMPVDTAGRGYSAKTERTIAAGRQWLQGKTDDRN